MSRRKSNWIIGLTVTAVVARLLVHPRFKSQNGEEISEEALQNLLLKDGQELILRYFGRI